MKVSALTTFLILALMGCSSVTSSSDYTTSRNSLDKAAIAADAQTECFHQWAGLVDDWAIKSGGMAGSIEKTKERILVDNESRFSALIREVWAAQPETVQVNFGSWPIDPSVERSLGEKVDRISEKYVTKECALHTMIGAELFNQLLDSRSNDRYKKFSEVPSDMEWEPYQGARYTFFWLFISNSAAR
jgi:hypothetical protein